MSAYTDVRDGIIDIAEDIISIPGELAEGLGDILEDIINLEWDEIDDSWDEMWHEIGVVSKKLIGDLHVLFQDDDFWFIVIIVTTLITLSAGINSATTAEAGTRWSAFLTGMKESFNKLNLGMFLRMNRIAMTVSPRFRKQFNKTFGAFTEKLGEAGHDVGTMSQLIGDIGGLFNSFSAMLGKTPSEALDKWSDSMVDFGQAVEKNTAQWAEDPASMFEWVRNNLETPYSAEAAGRMARLAEGIKWIDEKGSKLVDNVSAVGDNLLKVAGGIDELRGTDFAEQLKSGALSEWDIITEQWDTLSSQLGTIKEQLTVKSIANIVNISQAGETTLNTLTLETRLLQRGIPNE